MLLWAKMDERGHAWCSNTLLILPYENKNNRYKTQNLQQNQVEKISMKEIYAALFDTRRALLIWYVLE